MTSRIISALVGVAMAVSAVMPAAPALAGPDTATVIQAGDRSWGDRNWRDRRWDRGHDRDRDWDRDRWRYERRWDPDGRRYGRKDDWRDHRRDHRRDRRDRDRDDDDLPLVIGGLAIGALILLLAIENDKDRRRD